MEVELPKVGCTCGDANVFEWRRIVGYLDGIGDGRMAVRAVLNFFLCAMFDVCAGV